MTFEGQFRQIKISTNRILQLWDRIYMGIIGYITVVTSLLESYS